MTNLLDMKSLPIDLAKDQLLDIISATNETNEPVEIMNGDQCVAVLLSPFEYNGLIDTIEVLSDPEIMANLKEPIGAAATPTYRSLNEVIDELIALGKLTSDFRTMHGYKADDVDVESA